MKVTHQMTADKTQGEGKMSIDRLNADVLFEIACIIDNEYRQYRDERKNFVITRTFQRISLKTDKCDLACYISINYDGKLNVRGIKILAEDTDGWEFITEATMNKIMATIYLLTPNE